ncbi:MAG: transporter substrate-binding domain-containing protein [Bacteroidota bacterium]|nr:transporter substrate-binding domain-containing protein [Bacteroidota bacterium]MDP3143991.1 transporter substrate-binding domain-containing protein [Bacteroidota bacterium]MDP3557511.1 transporter substrate-binding domain-containing protein [Bacteroidota bacterium]
MKKIGIITLFIFCGFFCFSQIINNDTIFVHYFEKSPFSSTEAGASKGLEIDVLNDYLLWLKTTKKTTLVPKYVGYRDFEQFYISVKNASKNTIGLGSVTINPEKIKEIEFTCPYLKNVAFCITNGNAPDIKAKTQPEIIKALGIMTALTVTNTTLNKYTTELKKTYLPDLKIMAQTDATKILNDIAKNVLYFGYVDAVTFWSFVKNNPGKFVKNQKQLMQAKEEYGFILPKTNVHKASFNEFFTGFKKTNNYSLTLEKHLGSYMGQIMAVK